MPGEFKLGVFVGSTQSDLKKPRKEVIDAILHAGHIPNGMELWASGYLPTQQTIEEHLQLCDLHLILLGSRYGSFVDGQISFTEWEYETSKRAGRPVIAFLLNDAEFEAQLSSAKSPEPGDKIEKLRRLRKEVRSHALCREFSLKRTASVATDCVNAINEAINSGRLDSEAGWIRAASERAKQLRAVEKNEFLRRILNKVHSFSTLTDRLEDEPKAKRFLGAMFWDTMLGRIKRNGYENIFFESGSTIAFVSDAFEKIVLSSEGDDTAWKITTNNALSLLQLLLHTHFDVKPRPAGAPEAYYGAMFDSVLLRHREAAPTIPRNLWQREIEAVKSTCELLRPTEPNDSPQRHIFLAAASGVDLGSKEINFRGPHVGSHPNMLFKRAIFETGEPVVLFLTGGKINRPFEIGKCFPVFGSDRTWRSVCDHSKLALAIGYEPDSEKSGFAHVDATRENILAQLEGGGVLDAFDTEYAIRQSSDVGAMIIANDGFKSVFRKE